MKPSKMRLHSKTRRLWTFEEAQAAVPYFSALTRSLRRALPGNVRKKP